MSFKSDPLPHHHHALIEKKRAACFPNCFFLKKNHSFLAKNRPEDSVKEPDDAPDGARDAKPESAGDGRPQSSHNPEDSTQTLCVAHTTVDDVPTCERDALPLFVEEVGIHLGRSLDCFAGSAKGDVSEFQVFRVCRRDTGGEPDLVLLLGEKVEEREREKGGELAFLPRK